MTRADGQFRDSAAEEVLLPFDGDAADPEDLTTGSRDVEFLYIGEGKTAEEFSAYVAAYDFGSPPADYIVLHHTGVPGLNGVSWNTANPTASWNSGEEGLTDAQVYAKRKLRLDGMRNFYRDQHQWDRGPHLFIDDRYIWLFTPMSYPGIHAAWGNWIVDGDGNLQHYAVGIEVIGYYESQQWPEPVAQLVGHAIAVLKRRLGTFELNYMYPTPESKPGMVNVNNQWLCADPERRRWGGISSHRDYNKPTCPGAAITEEYYLGVLRAGWDRLTSGG